CRRPLRALPEADRCPRSGRATRPPPAGHARNLRRRSGGIRHAAAPSARARTGRRRTRLQYKDGPRPTTRAAASGSRRRECASGSTIVVLAVAELPLGKLAALLGLDAQRRDRTSLEAAQADLVARLLAVAVGAVLDALQRRVDLLQELSLAIARAQLEAELGLLRGPVVRVGEVRRVVLHVQDRSIHFLHQLALPRQQDVAEVLELPLAHVGLAALRLVRLEAPNGPEQDARRCLDRGSSGCRRLCRPRPGAARRLLRLRASLGCRAGG